MVIDRQFRVNYTSLDDDRISAVVESALDRNAPVLLYRPATTSDGMSAITEAGGRVVRWIAWKEVAAMKRTNETIEGNFERIERAFDRHDIEYVIVVDGLDTTNDEFDPEIWTTTDVLTFVASLALMLVVLVAFTGPLDRLYERTGNDRFLDVGDRLLEAAVVNRELHTVMFEDEVTSTFVRRTASAVEARTGREPIVVTLYDVRLVD